MNKRAQSTSIRRQWLDHIRSVLTLSLAPRPLTHVGRTKRIRGTNLRTPTTNAPACIAGMAPQFLGLSAPTGQLHPKTPRTEPTRSVDRASLVADINALRQDVARVRRSLESQDPLFSEAFERENEQRKKMPRSNPVNALVFKQKATPLFRHDLDQIVCRFNGTEMVNNELFRRLPLILPVNESSASIVKCFFYWVNPLMKVRSTLLDAWSMCISMICLGMKPPNYYVRLILIGKFAVMGPSIAIVK